MVVRLNVVMQRQWLRKRSANLSRYRRSTKPRPTFIAQAIAACMVVNPRTGANMAPVCLYCFAFF
ncbi:hypothetical protein SAMN02745117_01276 [Lampropedia hyalina DSM 16112]|uniref:Uncharacterized protein n=1 Tax=Lampropedia hyalina DSM 16112 TaxID=1122156 RepID=A0A1M4YNA5_9BURK|nr:hypothetical protein SAMN02745117_01276 [Lampropedia hyalina DSM 16112]